MEKGSKSIIISQYMFEKQTRHSRSLKEKKVQKGLEMILSFKLRFLAAIGPLSTLITLLMSAPVSAFGSLSDIPQGISLFPLYQHVAIVLFRKLHHSSQSKKIFGCLYRFPICSIGGIKIVLSSEILSKAKYLPVRIQIQRKN